MLKGHSGYFKSSAQFKKFLSSANKNAFDNCKILKKNYDARRLVLILIIKFDPFYFLKLCPIFDELVGFKKNP